MKRRLVSKPDDDASYENMKGVQEQIEKVFRPEFSTASMTLLSSAI
jgi:hypothetical protein